MRSLKHPRRVGAIVLGLALLLALFLSGLLSRPSPPLYTVTDLGTLLGDDNSTASAINNQGEIVGISSDKSKSPIVFHTFLYRNGRMSALASSHAPDDANGGPSINETGQVTGQMASVNGVSHAFFYSAGKIQDLGTLPGFPVSFGTSLNNQGEIVGGVKHTHAPLGKPYRHVFFSHAGRIQDIGALPGSRWESAAGINDAGQIAENSLDTGKVFMYDSHTGRRTVLSLPSGFTYPTVSGINNRSQLIGEGFDTANHIHIMQWSNGTATDIGLLAGTEADFAQCINNRGEAVGFATRSASRIGGYLGARLRSVRPFRRLLHADWTSRAFVYKDGRLSDLNDMISPNADWTLEEAHGINDRGQIVGQGLHHGQERAFLLTPIP